MLYQEVLKYSKVDDEHYNPKLDSFKYIPRVRVLSEYQKIVLLKDLSKF